MSFRDALGGIVQSVRGATGAVLVDADGETIDLFTRGDSYDLMLTGAHHGIVLEAVEGALRHIGNGSRLEGFSIRAEKRTYTIMPVREGIFLVLVQDETGLPSHGMKVLKEALPLISGLI
ncbi:MAG: roadblock/LC7 domain-containing protein [bacterium]|nr:MAG: roadblock/LC7 domain-containing protein [bacterium]